LSDEGKQSFVNYQQNSGDSHGPTFVFKSPVGTKWDEHLLSGNFVFGYERQKKWRSGSEEAGVQKGGPAQS